MVQRLVGGALVLLVTGCGALDVSDPTAVEPGDVANATGAELLRRNAVADLAGATATGALYSGLVSDELLSDAYFPGTGIVLPEQLLDQRQSGVPYETSLQGQAPEPYRALHEARRSATLALPRVRTYTPEPQRSASLGELFAIRAYATLGLAEQICPGFPLADFVDDKPSTSPPLSTDDAFQHALADFDSALAYATGSAKVLDLARIGRGRTLLGLGHFADARAAVAGVATDYLSIGQFDQSTGWTNPMGFYGSLSVGVGDHEGGTGLDFVSAADPRLPVTLQGTATDGVTAIYIADKYADPSTPIVLANGIEARLIEAEAALQAGDGTWLTILNDLRANRVTPALPPLADPGTFGGQVDLLFRERAFWLFGTGHRLGDLRRLIARYGRGSETVFPTGAYRLGGTYDAATSLPFLASTEAAADPRVTGCTSH
jgi:hypothetical protein